MRIYRYETERKRIGIGSSSAAGGAIAPGRQRSRRGCGNSWRFAVFGESVASGCGERRHGRLESKTASRTKAPLEHGAETSTRGNSFGWTTEGRVSQRFLDLSPDRRGCSEKIPCGVSPGLYRASASRLGLDLSDAGATGTRSGRRGHDTLAEARLAADKKGAARSVSPVVFLDESGFMLQPARRRTWAPSGQTPIQRAWDRHDRLSAVAFIGVSPSRRRLSLYFQLVPENIDASHMIWLLRRLHRHCRHHVILVLDRWNVHKSVTAYFKEHHPTWFTFEPLPSYSPKLNPVEQCWNYTKYSDLPNFIPDNLDHLYKAVDASITKQSKNQKLLQSFFAYAKLTLKPDH